MNTSMSQWIFIVIESGRVIDMTFEEWFKQTSEFSYIGPEAEEAERAWNYQQAKIDKAIFLLKLLDATAKSENFKISSQEVNEVIQELLK